MKRVVLLLCSMVMGLAPAAPVMGTVSSDEVLGAVEKVTPTIEQTSQKLWDLSEVSLLEKKSSAYLKDVLKKNGFKITSEGTANLPTAFIAE